MNQNTKKKPKAKNIRLEPLGGSYGHGKEETTKILGGPWAP